MRAGCTAAPFSRALTQPVAYKTRIRLLCIILMVKGVQFLNYRCGRSPRAPTTPFKAIPIYSAVNHPRGGRCSPPYPAIIKCFGTMWGIYKRWSNLFSLSPRSNGKYWLFFNRDKTRTCVLDFCGGFPLGWVWGFFYRFVPL